MVQYGQGEIVYRAARTRSGNGGLIHREADCDQLVGSGPPPNAILEKPLPSFPDWIPRCPECFDTMPNDDTAKDKQKAATHVDRAKDELEEAAETLDNAGQKKHLSDMAEEAEKTAEVLEDQAETYDE